MLAFVNLDSAGIGVYEAFHLLLLFLFFLLFLPFWGTSILQREDIGNPTFPGPFISTTVPMMKACTLLHEFRRWAELRERCTG